MTSIDTLNGQGFIQLVQHAGTDQTIVDAARVSYGRDMQNLDGDRDTKLIKYLLTNNHTSPFEHVTFTFHVKAPLFIARQWMRHRTWSFNEISARYTQVDSDYYTPTVFRGQSRDNKQMSDGEIDAADVTAVREAYEQSIQSSIATYKQLLATGVSREMARAVLPQAMFTRFYATVDLHNLMHFIRLRAHEHAQTEIREYATSLYVLARKHVPVTLRTFTELHPEL